MLSIAINSISVSGDPNAVDKALNAIENTINNIEISISEVNNGIKEVVTSINESPEKTAEAIADEYYVYSNVGLGQQLEIYQHQQIGIALNAIVGGMLFMAFFVSSILSIWRRKAHV